MKKLVILSCLQSCILSYFYCLLLCIDLVFEESKLWAQSSVLHQREKDVIEGRIAVLPILNKLGDQASLSRDEMHVLTTLVQNYVQKQTKSYFQVMTDENIRQLLPPGKSLEDCKGDCEVEYGRELGAHLIITGSLVKFGKKKNSMRLILKMHDTKAGTLQGTVMIQGGDAEEMENQLEARVIELTATLVAKGKQMNLNAQTAQTQGESSLQDQLRESLEEKNTYTPEDTQAQGETQNQNLDLEGELKLLEMEQLEKKAHQREIDLEWAKIIDVVRQGDLDRSLTIMNLFLVKYQQHPLGNHRLVEAGQLVNQLQTQIDTRKQKALADIHLKKVWESYEKFVKPLLEKGDDQGKTALDVFLKRYENHPLGNPLAQEAQRFYEERQAIREAEMKTIFMREIEEEWSRLKLGVVGGGERAMRVVEMFLRKYEGKKWENPFKLEARVVLAQLKSRETHREVEAHSGGRSEGLGGTENGKGMIEWVLIRGESFMMGSRDGESDEKPVHQVTVHDFYISKTEVTVAQYQKCVEAGVCSKPDISDSNCNWRQRDRENHPINCVDWKQARIFAKWVGGDLPSEAQWEYASRSRGKDMKYPWINAEATCHLANFNWDCHRGTTPVCSKTWGNTLDGLCDMGGNVREWVLDEWHSSYNGAPSDDIGWCSDRRCEGNPSADRIFRGGSWRSSASVLRSTFRSNNAPGDRRSDLGFRVSKTV